VWCCPSVVHPLLQVTHSCRFFWWGACYAVPTDRVENSKVWTGHWSLHLRTNLQFWRALTISRTAANTAIYSTRIHFSCWKASLITM
jgi:hypothetical protein